MNIKPKIDNLITIGLLLEFDIAFPNEEKRSIEQYLSGGSRSIILNSAAFFLGFKNHNSRFENNKDFIEMFFCHENNDIASQIYDRIKEFEKSGTRVGIINPYSSLKLFELYFSRPEEPETQTQAEFEINLFKAYLILNSEFTKKQSVALPSAEQSGEKLKIPMMLFCMQYPVSDKSNYDIKQIWVTQMIKAIYLFQFLESHNQAHLLLQVFLAHFNCSTWQEYLKKLLPLTLPAINSEKEAHTNIVVEQDSNFEQGCAFIEKLMVQEQDKLDQNDFLTIRARPFYKIEDGVYRIILNLFVVEKIFKGVYFLLRDLNKTLPEENRIKEIKSFYGHEFSEKILFYKVLERFYSKSCTRFSGEELEAMKIDAAPDYYIRNGKNILLFESKDFLIPAEKKMSFDFRIYKDEFERILKFERMPNGNIKPKAVEQLINSIRRILKMEFSPDTEYNYKKVYIYPILVTHDNQYNTPGFNELIDYWFQESLLKLKAEGLFIHHVKPLSVVNIDSLIYHHVGLVDGIQLHKVLNLYQDNKIVTEKKNNFKSQAEYDQHLAEFNKIRMSKLIPFSLFIDNYFKQLGFDQRPPMLDLIAPALFKQEYEAKE